MFTKKSLSKLLFQGFKFIFCALGFAQKLYSSNISFKDLTFVFFLFLSIKSANLELESAIANQNILIFLSRWGIKGEFYLKVLR